MPNTKLILLHPIDGGKNLSHTKIYGYHSQRDVWEDLLRSFNIVDPHTIQELKVIISPAKTYSLELKNYRNRGGLENADLSRWLQSKKLTDTRMNLLFEVYYIEDNHSLCYKFVGAVSRHNIIRL